jgi:hypothetical protein
MGCRLAGDRAALDSPGVRIRRPCRPRPGRRSISRTCSTSSATAASTWWAYLAGPLAGAVIAVGCAWTLRGPGGGAHGTEAAQGTLGIA